MMWEMGVNEYQSSTSVAKLFMLLRAWSIRIVEGPDLIRPKAQSIRWDRKAIVKTMKPATNRMVRSRITRNGSSSQMFSRSGVRTSQIFSVDGRPLQVTITDLFHIILINLKSNTKV